ncbi:hypothetical protein E2C01_100616 [Portunus trituberculatus]|uniref:Uncharacterized protein n=1 Tax=Portunus trituberculatus TaxID=210409 RepID=A0A5B7KJW5_PORTR|nr:hypothetical protein [Portunus trituberculatus]
MTLALGIESRAAIKHARDSCLHPPRTANTPTHPSTPHPASCHHHPPPCTKPRIAVLLARRRCLDASVWEAKVVK